MPTMPWFIAPEALGEGDGTGKNVAKHFPGHFRSGFRKGAFVKRNGVGRQAATTDLFAILTNFDGKTGVFVAGSGGKDKRYQLLKGKFAFSSEMALIGTKLIGDSIWNKSAELLKGIVDWCDLAANIFASCQSPF
jgi:hypothetical protein